MRKQFLVYTIVAMSAIGLNADVLTPDQALSRIASEKGAHKVAARELASRSELAHTFEAAGRPGVYVFNDSRSESGYLILSADDCAPAVLGYTDDGGAFDIATAPSNLVKWLEGYANQIAWASQYGGKVAVKAKVPEGRKDVEPKIKTMWDQGYPYHSWCPWSSGKKSYTGCVATAMAQIANWHKLPHKPTGSHTYQSYYTGTHSIDMDTVSFKWDKMLDKYDANSPYENKAAVAGLMQACGYVCDMEYTSWASGAASMRAAWGLAEFFGFDKAVSIQERNWYGNKEWEQMVYDELTTNGPVYYDGDGEGGGHAFVCDGYNATDGFYHFNWGWSGQSNGYYRLDALIPEIQGAGGVSIGYDWGQGIMRGLCPAKEGSVPVYQIQTGCGVRSPWESQVLGKNVSMTGYETNDGFRNCSNDLIPQVQLGVEFKSKATGEIRYVNETKNINTLEPTDPVDWAYAKRQLVILYYLPADLAAGDYEVRPVYRTNGGEWIHMKGNASIRQNLTLHVEDGIGYFSLGTREALLDVKIEEVPDYFTTSDSYTVKCKVTNKGTADYVGEICSVFIGERLNSKNESELYVAAQGYHRFTPVDAGQTIEFEYTSTNPTGKIVDGEYLLCFGDCNSGEIIGDTYPVKVGNRFGSLKFHYYELNIDNRSMLDAENVHVSWMMDCPQGMYNGPMALLVSKTKKPFNPEYAVLSEPMEFAAVETKKVDFTGKLVGPKVGDIVYCCPGYIGENGEYIAIGTNPISGAIAIEAVPSGVVEIDNSSEVVSVSVADMAGRTLMSVKGPEVDMTTLPSGIYLVTSTHADGKRSTTKVNR